MQETSIYSPSPSALFFELSETLDEALKDQNDDQIVRVLSLARWALLSADDGLSNSAAFFYKGKLCRDERLWPDLARWIDTATFEAISGLLEYHLRERLVALRKVWAESNHDGVRRLIAVQEVELLGERA